MSDYDSDEIAELFGTLGTDDENELRALERSEAALKAREEPCTSASISRRTPRNDQNSKIDAALALNSLLDEKLRRLENILITRLRECREKLKDIQRLPHVDSENKTQIFLYSSCGKPYFKDSSNLTAPDNEDTILMKRSGMYDFSNISTVSGWTVKDKSKLLTLVHKMSKEIRKKELHSKISDIRRQGKCGKKEREEKISAIQLQIARVNKMSLNDLAVTIEQDYDWSDIANKLGKRHTANECQALWTLFLHPRVNKSPWSKAEHEALQKIAFEENMQDWDKIAQRLGTGRTSYQCFVYFRTNMNNTFTRCKWSNEEVVFLQRLIEYFRVDNYIPWGKVASSMENRTKIQVYNKYLSLCQHRKGRFLPEEDAVIMTCAEQFGTNFRRMVQYLPGRTSRQCRVRYQILAKKRFSMVWTAQEDKRLIQLMANQDSPKSYSSVTKYFPGKDRVNIRARYLTLIKWMRRNPSVDISKAPKRGARRLGHGNCSDDLEKAIEDLKHRIQSEVNDIKSKKVAEDSPEDVVDDAIVASLHTERVKLEEAKKIETFRELDKRLLLANNTAKDCTNSKLRDIRSQLILLRAKLDRDKFNRNTADQDSEYSQYRGLLEADPDFFHPNVKSYSKTNTSSNPSGKAPDIWGNETLGPLEYVLPPNYATLIGCKKLMSYVASMSCEDAMNVKVSLRQNLLLKEQVFLLMERFNALFLWPMLLSNSAPDPYIMMNMQEKVYHVNSTTVQPTQHILYQKDDLNLSIPYYINPDVVKDNYSIKDVTEQDGSDHE